MSRIIEAWESLLKEATSRDYDTQQGAVFQISLVLERHNGGTLPDELYEENLSRELLRLTLDEKRQMEAIGFLLAMVRANDSEAETFLYALGKAKLELVVAPLLDVIAERGARWEDEAAYQAVSILLACAKGNNEATRQTLITRAPFELLETWAERDDALLSEAADVLLDKLDALMHPDSE